VETAERDRLEADVRLLCQKGDHAAATAAAMRGYGPELLGFLVAILRSETEASDAFSELSEILWRKLPGFAWESTLRTWLYGIARNVASTLRRNAARRRRRVGDARSSEIENVAQAVRTQTLAYLRTAKRTRLQELRDQLPEEDRMLLVLRVDRRLEWNELARVLAQADGDDDAPMEEARVVREAARLRKRFQIVKDRLRELARIEGLID
jgi:RNA polymerase sigma-70 factor (ECF subfamily)